MLLRVLQLGECAEVFFAVEGIIRLGNEDNFGIVWTGAGSQYDTIDR